jgi:serine/threonine protein kinase
MSLQAGDRIGPYEILGPLGAGGMGEVYRARDTKLGRAVAIKLLPDTFASDPQRVARFQREAQVLAALNHPHIAQIYGLEDSTTRPALVMELVEGATLADRLSAGPLPVAETIVIARQMAEAVEAAHEKGIIHRDLKPGNVMLTADGDVKVLDFGLAAVTETVGPGASDATHSPTLSMAATVAGVILGTAAYMSPEQAIGKPADKRADVWSFGVILWEMLTGRRLFQGETVAHTLADVLRAPINFEILPRDTPPRVRELLQRCLDRDPRTRLRDIGEARVALNAALSTSSPEVAPGQSPGSSRALAAVSVVAAVTLASTLVLGFVHFRETPTPDAAVRFEVLPPDDSRFNANAVISPDGGHLAFSAPGPDGVSMLWLRALDSTSARPLPGTAGATSAPFWSPDRQPGHP